MLQTSHLGNNHFLLKITEPRLDEDEDAFFVFLQKILSEEKFGLILSIDGEKSFSLEARQKLGKWFQANKVELKNKCMGLARIQNHSFQVDEQDTLRMKRAMPCAYEVFLNQVDAHIWLQART